MSTFRKVLIALLLIVFTQGCILTVGSGLPTGDVVEPTLTSQANVVSLNTPIPSTATPLPTPTVAPTATVILPTPLPSLSSITITAIDGNLFIRRGPGMPYNPIGFLRKGVSAQVIAVDVLSNWAQINVPDMETTGWVYLHTPYSKIDGDLSQIPDFTFTEWPAPAYIKNCTEHDMFITPGNTYLPSLYTNAKFLNEYQVDPGTYIAYDMYYPDEPEAQVLEVREGVTVYITINGRGEGHKCP